MKFKTKKDVIYYIFSLICILLTILGFIRILKIIDLTSMTLIGSSLIIDLIFLPIMCYSYYKLDMVSLIIRFGFIKINIQYTSITKIIKINNSIAAAATSTKRVQIDYIDKDKKEYNTIYISPINRDLFINELQNMINNNTLYS